MFFDTVEEIWRTQSLEFNMHVRAQEDMQCPSSTILYDLLNDYFLYITFFLSDHALNPSDTDQTCHL